MPIKYSSRQSHLNFNIYRPTAPNIGLIITLLILCISIDVRAQETNEEYRQEANRRLQAHVNKLQSLPDTSQRSLGLAQAYFFMASILETKEEKLKLHQRGVELAEQVLKTDPENKKALLWSVVNALGKLRIKQPFAAIWRLGQLEKRLIELRNRDQIFEYAAADRVLAIIYAESPRWIIGSKTKARKHFQDTLEIASEFPANKILYAEFLIDQDEFKNAQSLLLEVESDNSLARYPIYEMLWRMDINRIRNKSD